MKTPLAEFAIRCNSTAAKAYKIQTGADGISLPDPIAMAVLLDPALKLEASKHVVEIETTSEITRGMTVVDRLNVAGDSRNRGAWSEAIRQGVPSEICWKIDVPGWKYALLASLA